MSEPSSYSEQIQKLMPAPGDLLVLSLSTPLTREQREKMSASFSELVKTLGCKMVMLEPGMSLSLQPDPAALLAEMRKQTAILESMSEQQVQLLEALAEGEQGEEPDTEPSTYLDGTPIVGGS
jgi:hypothetical protein